MKNINEKTKFKKKVTNSHKVYKVYSDPFKPSNVRAPLVWHLYYYLYASSGGDSDARHIGRTFYTTYVDEGRTEKSRGGWEAAKNKTKN